MLSTLKDRLARYRAERHLSPVSREVSEPESYGFLDLITTGDGTGIRGGIGGGPSYSSHAVFYVGVPSVEAALQRAVLPASREAPQYAFSADPCRYSRCRWRWRAASQSTGGVTVAVVGVRRSRGTICLATDGLDHSNWTRALPSFS